VPDCNDLDASIYPGAIEICDAFSTDEDCDGEINEAGAEGGTLFFGDADGDGYGVAGAYGTFCSLPPTGYADNADDCDDTDPDVSPDADELCDDDIDNDCDGAIDGYDSDTDGDEDGFSACSPLDETVDCDDTDPDINPDADEVCGDELDNDCDGAVDEAGAEGSVFFYADTDTDGYGDPDSMVAACSPPPGFVSNDDDCDDTSSAIKPTATEYCDSVDNDCDGNTDEPTAVDARTWYFDGAGDGFGDVAEVGCAPLSIDYVVESGDCDDTDPTAYPGATEVCDGVLNDCDLTEADGPEAVDQPTWHLDVAL